jgi:hypothetical protein
MLRAGPENLDMRLRCPFRQGESARFCRCLKFRTGRSIVPEIEGLALDGQVMQYLRSGDWNVVAKLPIAATAGALNRLADYGWIERRGGGPRSEIKLTAAGLAALQAPI